MADFFLIESYSFQILAYYFTLKPASHQFLYKNRLHPMQKTKVISLRVINILCQKKANMGANFSVSDLNKANAQRRVKTPRIMFLKDQFMAMENPDASRDPNKTSRIKAFHSKDQWEVYFNASKESKKLVITPYYFLNTLLYACIFEFYFT